MAKDYASLDRVELESTLLRLKEELEDLEEMIGFYYSNSASHISGGEVIRDEETIAGLRSEIAEVEALIRQTEQTAPSDFSSGVRSEVMEHIDADGFSYLIERFERLVPVYGLEYRMENKIACEACPVYGRNLACPPTARISPIISEGSANRQSYATGSIWKTCGRSTESRNIALRII